MFISIGFINISHFEIKNTFVNSDIFWYFLRMNNSTKKDSIRLSEYIEEKLKKGAITFTKSEAIKSLGCSDFAFMRAAQRLQKKGHIVRPVSGFYVIVEIEFRDAGGPIPIYFIDKLMRYLELPYYVGLLSAAKYHGATHQAVFETQVIVPKPISKIKYGKNCIQFVTNKFTEKIPKESLKTPHGDVLISTPEATLVDLVRYHKKSAGYSHVATVILEMNEKINGAKLSAVASIYNDIPLIQRVGYLLETFGNKAKATSLHKWMIKKDHQLIKLEPGSKLTGKKNAKWSIEVNAIIEPDDV